MTDTGTAGNFGDHCACRSLLETRWTSRHGGADNVLFEDNVGRELRLHKCELFVRCVSQKMPVGSRRIV